MRRQVVVQQLQRLAAALLDQECGLGHARFRFSRRRECITSAAARLVEKRTLAVRDRVVTPVFRRNLKRSANRRCTASSAASALTGWLGGIARNCWSISRVQELLHTRRRSCARSHVEGRRLVPG